LSAVNSINWARIVVQIVYYFHAAVALGAPDRQAAFAVPTGNFGNVYAGYAAAQMGLPVRQLIVASNSNDILTRFFETGTMKAAGVRPTLSPSMDIEVSSNFERLLFDLCDRDGQKVADLMAAFREFGGFEASGRALALFAGYRVDDEETIAEMARVYRETGALLDPHSAVGVAAARAKAGDREAPVVALATAHPAKFPDAVETATGIRPVLPTRLADLFNREEHVARLANDLVGVQTFIRERARIARPAAGGRKGAA
jgi:threonine synthase